jgi:muramoyltetrapeptide carboxypeptidase
MNAPRAIVTPPRPRRGDTIVVVASSSSFEAEKLERGVSWLRARYRVEVRRDIHERRGFLAGTDARRREELQAALDAPNVAAIVAARGGYGLTRILASIEWRGFLAAPKWIVGFSDVTALHLEVARHGVASLHAPMLAWLGDANEATRAAWIASLEGAATSWSDLEIVARGDGAIDRVEGPAFGGNLAMLHDCAAADRLRVPEGAVVFLEDIGERPYRVDRMLTALVDRGSFEKISAIVLGDFTDCGPGPDGARVDDVIADRLARVGCLVVRGAPFGHGARNDAFPLGALATIAIADARATVTLGR